MHALTSSCMCNVMGMVAALGLHQPANKGKGGDRVRGVWMVNERGLGQGDRAVCRMRGVQEEAGVKVAGVDEFRPPGEGPPVFSRLF